VDRGWKVAMRDGRCLLTATEERIAVRFPWTDFFRGTA
jgi:hypothetical protein